MAIDSLKVDGGLTNDPTLLQLQADLLGLELRVGRPDATVLGAAMLAGVGAGLIDGVEQAAALLGEGRVVRPRLAEQERLAARREWRRFVVGCRFALAERRLIAALGERRQHLLGVARAARLERQLDTRLADVQSHGFTKMLDADDVGPASARPGPAARPARRAGRARG